MTDGKLPAEGLAWDGIISFKKMLLVLKDTLQIAQRALIISIPLSVCWPDEGQYRIFFISFFI